MDFNFPLHFHTSFELLYVEEGAIEVTVDKSVYLTQGGSFVLIPPDATHSYHTPQHSRIGILILNTDLLPEIYEEMKMGIYRSPVIENGEALFQALTDAENNIMLFRATLYRIAAMYEENELLNAPAKIDDDFAFKLSTYIERHYTETLSGKSIAMAMGYHPRYLSTLIKKGFGTSFSRLLNDYRIKAACSLLREGKQNVTEIWTSTGFESQSAFHRNFKEIMGMTPLQYRQGYRIGCHNHGENKPVKDGSILKKERKHRALL